METGTIHVFAIAIGALLVASDAGAAPPTATPPPAIAVTPHRIVKANVRATATLYAASTFDEMKLFDVVERIASDVESSRVQITSKQARALIDGYAKARPDRITKANRLELTRFVSELVQSVFGQIVTDSVKQMEAYAALVRDVAASVDQFARDNTSQNQGRDSLEDRYPEDGFKPATELALSLSQHGYGAAQLAASKLAEQIRDASAILADPAIQGAYGARSQWDLVEKAGGKPAAESERAARRAEAGSQLIGVLADSAELLDAPKKARAELARRLATAAPSAKVWLTAKPSPLPKMPPKTVRPLCFDERRNLVPCTVTKS